GNVFMSGDRALVGSGYGANFFVFTKSTGLWTQLVSQNHTISVARPHADVRALYLNTTAAAGSATVNSGAVIIATDGGLWRLDLSTKQWTSMNAGGGAQSA